MTFDPVDERLPQTPDETDQSEGIMSCVRANRQADNLMVCGVIRDEHRETTPDVSTRYRHAMRDNLGDQVPVCAAEVRVIEAYLDEVLRDVLGLGGPGQDSQTS